MAPDQQTLRITGLPPASTDTDVQYHFDGHVKDKGRTSVVGVGPICKEPDANTNQTTVTFSSTKAANDALCLDEKAKRLTAVQGGAGTFSLDEGFRGMTTLQCLVNPKTRRPDIDIVAVHGLTGHAWKTFTATANHNPDIFVNKENNWLQENLPRLLNQHKEQSLYSRVMTFGYDADVWMTNSAADLDVPVSSLLWCLKKHTQDDPDRPLFFIGHSLGGIVVKEAIVKLADEVLVHSLDSDQNSQKKYIFPVKGCLFFGVPHQGAKVAKLASMFLMNLPKVFKLNTNNVHDLQPKSERLVRVSYEFESTRSNLDLPVMSFYETMNLSQITGLVVSAESAVLDYPGKPRPFGIEKDHKEMVKFLADSDQGLQAAVLFLVELAKQAVRQQDAQHKLDSKALVSKLTGAGGLNIEDRLSILRDYDTVVLIDDSPSMAGRNWDLVKEILDVCTPVATYYDTDGIDIDFINNQRSNQPNVKDPKIAVQIHHQITCMGRSLLVDRIATHLKGYFQGYQKAEYAANYKRYNLIVITDGEPDDEGEEDEDPHDAVKPVFRLLQKKLVNFAKKLDKPEVEAETGQVGIQFCQIGNDKAATAFFEFLDDRLKSKEGLGRDMIDTIKCVSEADLTEEFYRKLLTGAIDKGEDRKRLEEQPVATPPLEQNTATPRPATIPDRSTSTRTNISRAFSEADTLVGPSRGFSFPVDFPLKQLKEEPTEGSANPHIPISSTRQSNLRPHGTGYEDQTSPPTHRSTFGRLKRLSVHDPK